MSKQKEKTAQIYVRDIKYASPEVKQRVENAVFLAYATMLNGGRAPPIEARAFIRKNFMEKFPPKEWGDSYKKMYGEIESGLKKFARGIILVMEAGYTDKEVDQEKLAKSCFGGLDEDFENLPLFQKHLAAALGVSDKGNQTPRNEAQINSGHIPIAFYIGQDANGLPLVSPKWPSWIGEEQKIDEGSKISGVVPKKRTKG